MSNQENLLEQTRGNATVDEEVITQITLAGLKVIMLRKGDQIIYKLPDDVSVSSLPEEQRDRLEKEIQQLHTATLAAAAARTSSHSEPPLIAPKQNGMPTPQPIAAAPAPDATNETSKKEDREQSQQQQHQSLSKEVKTTRKYVKTGKYSKKKQHQHQQQPVASTPQAASLPPSGSTTPQPLLPQQQQQSLFQLMATATAATAAVAAHPQPLPPQPQQPQQDQLPQPPQPVIPPTMALPSFLSSKSILAKRLPEEEAHHQEIKRRIYEAIAADHKAVANPTYETPFKSVQDAIDRLLPYHIYQYPKADLNVNKIPIESQDHLTIEIFKGQTAMLERFKDVSTKIREGKGTKQMQVMVERQLNAEQRQKLTEEQARVAAEQQAEAARAQVEQARLNSANYVTAFLQNPQFLAQYNQLTPELRQQLFQNQEQLASLLEKHTKDLAATANATPTQQQQQQQQQEPQPPPSE